MGVEIDLGVFPYEASIPEDKKIKALRMVGEWTGSAAAAARSAPTAPEDRVDELNQLRTRRPERSPAAAAAGRGIMTVLKAQELHGMLNWVKEILVQGSFHLVHTVAAYRITSRGGTFVPSRAFRAEMAWWESVLTDFNCRAIILPPVYATPAYSWTESPTTDACKSRSRAGAGAWFMGAFDYFTFTEEERATFDIMELEAIVFVMWVEALLRANPSKISGRRWRTRCDNLPWVQALTSGKSNEPVVAALLARISAQAAVRVPLCGSGRLHQHSRQHSSRSPLPPPHCCLQTRRC